MKSSRIPTMVSLFSGCGGLDLGFVQEGFRSLLSVDIDDAALAVHRSYFASPIQKLDLSSENPPIADRERIDVLLAGSPCQGFSTAGRRRFDDPRNRLLLVAARVAEQIKPKVVVVENVPGALSGEHLAYWEQLQTLFRGLGYQTADLRIDSATLGVAQTRRRIFLICWRTGAAPNLQMDTHKPLVLSDVLQLRHTMPNHHPMILESDSQDYRIALNIGAGQKLTNARGGLNAVHTWNIPEVFGVTTALERDVLQLVLRIRRQVRRRDYGDADPVSTKYLSEKFGPEILSRLVGKGFLRQIDDCHDLTHTFNGKYRRLRADAPSRTVDTRFGDPRLFLHPSEHRGFTVREAARIQGFPDDMIFSGSRSQQFRMIGNAVPPPVAREIARISRRLI